MRGRLFFKAVLAAAFLACSLQAQALDATAQVTDVADAVPGQDIWRYDIAVSGDLQQFGAVEFSFAFGAFGDLQAPAAVSAPFELSVVQPEPAFGFDGLLRFTTQQPVTAGTFQFQAQVISLAGSPGALPFTVYDGNGDILQTGLTVAAIPEPPAVLLLLCGLLCAPLVARRARG